MISSIFKVTDKFNFGVICNFGAVLLLQIYDWIFAIEVIPQITQNLG
jgi:Ni/Fe-hydrogenase subunit HybB-like protein